MGDQEKKTIFVLLIIIAIFSGILIIRMNITPKYNPELYDEIYAEYENMIETAEENNENATTNTTKKKKKKTTNTNIETTTASAYTGSGRYTVVGEIMISKLQIAYPVINETTDENLKIAPTKLMGPNMNEVGNFCIAGHNYKNNQFFSKLSTLSINDTISLTSNDGKKINYAVYKKYEVNENDFSCTNQDTGGKIEATLITCTNEKSKRLILKCRAI